MACVAALSITAMAFSAAVSPAAAEESETDVLAVLENLDAVTAAPEQDVLADVADHLSSDTANAAAVAVDGEVTSIAVDPEGGVIIGTDSPFTIGLPFADEASDAETVADGVVVFENNNDTLTVPTIKDDGSVQIATIIESDSAPTRYVYELGFPAGVTAALGDEGQVVLLDSDGTFFGGIASPWATAADGTAVPTHYELVGSTLTQVVEHVGYAYPVVADPWGGKNLILRASVTQKIGWHIVNATPTTWGRQNFGLATHSAHVAELKVRLGPNNSWRVDANNGTIREQFLCHVFGNAFEPGEYNMESNRPAMHWASQLNLIVKCNP
jgi:hypothetical protein